MSFKKLMRKIHLWLALPSAIILFIVFITGSIFTYTDELLNLYHSPYSKVSIGEKMIPVEDIIKELEIAYPRTKAASLIVKNNPESSYRFLMFNKTKGLSNVFVNPYTGEILGESRAHQFFYTVAHLHGELLLGKVGEWIVKIATIIMLILVITGFIVWYPKKLTPKNRKNFFALNLKKKFRLTAHNHHSVLGFYFTAIMLLLVITGIIMAFHPLSDGIAKAIGGGKSGVVSDYINSKNRVPLLNIIEKMEQKKGVEEMRIALMTRNDNGITRIIAGNFIGILTYNGDVFFVDKVTGKEIQDTKERANIEAENLIMELHTGKWMGWFGKFVTFFSGVAGAYLIITGIVIWWNKVFRKKTI